LIVVDSSFLLALITPDRRKRFVKTVMAEAAGDLHAPLLMPFEVLNVLSRKFRAGDVSRLERDVAIADLERQLISYDARPGSQGLERIATFAAEQSLSGYDASYLELAMRLGAALGTLDGELADAGRRCGLVVHHA